MNCLEYYIEEHRRNHWGNRPALPGELSGMCGAESRYFQWYLSEEGVANTVVCSDPDRLGYYGRTISGCLGHTVNRVGDVYIDWTATQYGYPEFPKVFQLRAFPTPHAHEEKYPGCVPEPANSYPTLTPVDGFYFARFNRVA